MITRKVILSAPAGGPRVLADRMRLAYEIEDITGHVILTDTEAVNVSRAILREERNKKRRMKHARNP